MKRRDAARDMQPLGAPVDWAAARAPSTEPLRGRHVTLRRPLLDDAGALFAAGLDTAIWTYLPYGPYADETELRRRLEEIVPSQDPLFFCVCPLPGERAQGMASFVGIQPQRGSIEIGHIWFGSGLQRTAAATEAVFLLAREAFDRLGYRRLEWSCNALNARSRGAAERFGFLFEGVFRNHQVVKGRNRDTAWYSITDDEWPPIRAAFERWLSPDNFDATGRQRTALGELIAQSLR